MSIGIDEAVKFYDMVQNYTNTTFIKFPQNATIVQTDSIMRLLDNYDIVIASIHLTDIRSARNYGITPIYQTLIGRLVKKEHVVINLLANIFILNKIPELQEAHTLLVGYQQNKYLEEASAQVIFGGLIAKGNLPVTINNVFVEGMSVKLPQINRLSYGIPDQLGIDGKRLKVRLDSTITEGLIAKAYPGAVVSVAYKGKVIYQNAYGGQTYESTINEKLDNVNVVSKIDDAMDDFSIQSKKQVVAQEINLNRGRKEDIYDLASITKVAASALAIMQLKSIGKFDEDMPFKQYFTEFENTNKAMLSYKDMLTHRSGLVAWIPFWRDAIDTISLVAKISESDKLSNQLVYDIKKV
ncbi:MAG TPA: serine hydrolase, partial [Saprospiraceae bacterium]|nr:serine hydrolase [Saprospiraceae bacterium]